MTNTANSTWNWTVNAQAAPVSTWNWTVNAQAAPVSTWNWT